MEEEDNQYPQLLYMPATEHRTSQIEKKGNDVMRVNAHKCGIEYHERMAPALKRLGLYQISQLEDCQIDRSLISALVERWRPETNTFHFRWGEMTVTLEDVSILWGLPLRGKPISGVSDDEWSGLIVDCLGIDPAYEYDHPNTGPWMYKVRNRGKENEWLSFSGYHLRFAWLRQKFKRLPDDADEETLAYHTRAYCLDLMGSVMFPDTSSDGVPAMFLQFLENLDDPPEYNWGCAVLSYLYRELTRGCRAGTESLAGPQLLLQMWSWTRLNVGRPELLYDHSPWGGDDPDARNAYGVKWTTRHTYPENPHHGGTGHFRDQLEVVPSEGVSWRPYGKFYGMLPTYSVRDCDLWMVRMPMIFFWIVEFHYPDRVMRQFGMYQSVPPPPPEPWDVVKKLHSYKHVSGRGSCIGVDWTVVHKSYIDVEPVILNEERGWDPNMLRDYMHWFHTRCMDTSWPHSNDPDALSQPLPPIHGNVNDLAYISHGNKYRRVVLRTMHTTAHGISWLLTRGKKAVGKLVLQMCRGTMADLDQSHIYEGMLTRAGLPADVNAVPVDDDVPTSIPSMPPPIEYQSMPPPTEYQSGYDFFGINTTRGEGGYQSYMELLFQNTPELHGISQSNTFVPTPSMYGAGSFTTEGGPSSSQPSPSLTPAVSPTQTVPPNQAVPPTQAGPSQQDGRPVRKKTKTNKYERSGRKQRKG